MTYEQLQADLQEQLTAKRQNIAALANLMAFADSLTQVVGMAQNILNDAQDIAQLKERIKDLEMGII